MVDITTIPTDELEKDLEDSRKDIAVCQVALDMNVTEYSGGSVEKRLKGNQHFIDVITNELGRRAEAKKSDSTSPNNQSAK